MNLELLLRLLPQTFRLRRSSLHYPSWRRITAVGLLLPLATLGLGVNWLCLGLDRWLFPGYRRQATGRVAFITGVPRSATSFLFHLLGEDRARVTCFRLWEILLAPSVLQKYCWLALLRLDGRVGRPLRRMARWLEKRLFARMAHVHPLSLAQPEEDEVLLLHPLATAYLCYFFPEAQALAPYLYFDEQLSPRAKARAMHFYRACVQRHNYVFNRDESRLFLSKNPAFTPKLRALHQWFPTARVLYLLRSPYRTIPATISLNAHLYGAFCHLPEPYPMQARTQDMVIAWYRMAQAAQADYPEEQWRTVLFNALTRDTLTEVAAIYAFLDLPLDGAQRARVQAQAARPYHSQHRYDPQVGLDEGLIQAQLHFLPDELRRWPKAP